MKDDMKRLHEGMEGSIDLAGGYELVMDYGDPAGEARAARESAAIIELSGQRAVRVCGEDRISWLNSMVTNNIKILKPGQGAYSALATHKGKMLADMQVYCLPEALLLVSQAGCIGTILETLQKYIITEDVTLSDASDEYVFFSLIGPEIADALKEVAPDAANNPPKEKEILEFDAVGGPVMIAGGRRAKAPCLDVVAPAEAALPFWNGCCAAGARPMGHTALNALRVEAGIPLYGADMDEGYFPQEAAIEARAVDFNKGCYIGQETICRIYSRGDVKRTLAGALLPEDWGLPLGEAEVELFDGDDRVGRLTSFAILPDGRKAALITVAKSHLEEGTALSARLGDRSQQIIVAALPF